MSEPRSGRRSPGGEPPPPASLASEPSAPGRATEPGPEPAARAERARAIGIWGAAAGGKSTFLGALYQAALDAKTHRSWVLDGVDSSSRAYLSNIRSKLWDEGTFPPPTLQSTNLNFVLVGADREATAESTTRELFLEVIDRPGADFAPRRDDGTDPAAEIVKELADCSGLVYLFDPVNDDEARYRDDLADAFRGNATFFCDVAEALFSKVRESGGLEWGRLPHHLAVCVAKLDADFVFRAARELGVLTWSDGEHEPPRVDRGTAREFFEHLCQSLPRYRQVSQIPRLIDRLFIPERVTYFVSSSIGFFHEPGKPFDLWECTNVEADDTGEKRLRGNLRPINVLEPILAAAEEWDEL